MGKKFTWHEKFSETLKKVPSEYRGDLALAMIDYGTYGIEPEFDEWGLSAAFEGVRDDIDNSIKARNQNGGGRPPKTSVPGGGNGGLSTEKPPLSEQQNGGLTTGEPPLEQVATHTKPSHTKPSHTKPRKEIRRFAPPSVDEVRAFCSEKGYEVDAEQFVAFYESKGWKVGSSAMKSWEAACVTWHKRTEPKGGAGNGDIYSAL